MSKFTSIGDDAVLEEALLCGAAADCRAEAHSGEICLEAGVSREQ